MSAHASESEQNGKAKTGTAIGFRMGFNEGPSGSTEPCGHERGTLIIRFALALTEQHGFTFDGSLAEQFVGDPGIAQRNPFSDHGPDFLLEK